MPTAIMQKIAVLDEYGHKQEYNLGKWYSITLAVCRTLTHSRLLRSALCIGAICLRPGLNQNEFDESTSVVLRVFEFRRLINSACSV